MATDDTIEKINEGVYPFRILSAQTAYGGLGLDRELGYDSHQTYNIWRFRWTLSAHAPSEVELLVFEPLIVTGFLNASAAWCPGAEFFVDDDALGEVGWCYDTTTPKLLLPGRYRLHIRASANFFCHTVWGFSRPKESCRPPIRYLSIGAICKDENAYLEEWFQHHFALGVDHIFLLDNGSRSPLADTVSQSEFADRVTIECIPSIGTDTQHVGYAYLLRRYGITTTWLALIDIDEFIVPKKVKDLRRYLRCFEDFGGIEVPWMMFGSDGRIDKPRSQREAFTLGYQNNHVKSIVQPRYVTGLPGAHQCRYVPNRPAVGDSCSGVSTRDIQINHYWTRSRSEWQDKIDRGALVPGVERNWSDFEEHQKLCIYRDQSICSLIKKSESPSASDVRVPRPIHGFMHFATANQWRAILRSQMRKIENSGLYELCSSITVSVVGCTEEEIKECLPNLPAKYKTVVHGTKMDVFEFPTLQLLEKQCHQEDCFVFYVHSKGVLNHVDCQMGWRSCLEQLVLGFPEIAITKLSEGYAVASTILSGDPRWYVPGNFWWSRSEHICSLPPIKMLDTRNRFEAERWIGMNGKGDFYSMRTGGSRFTSFIAREVFSGAGHLATDGYLGHCDDRVLFDSSWNVDYILASHAPSVIELDVKTAIVVYGLFCRTSSPQGTAVFKVDGSPIGSVDKAGQRTKQVTLASGTFTLSIEVARGAHWGCHSAWAVIAKA